VDVRAILHALSRIYHADALVEELTATTAQKSHGVRGLDAGG
jgi:hypothetical protein